MKLSGSFPRHSLLRLDEGKISKHIHFGTRLENFKCLPFCVSYITLDTHFVGMQYYWKKLWVLTLLICLPESGLDVHCKCINLRNCGAAKNGIGRPAEICVGIFHNGPVCCTLLLN